MKVATDSCLFGAWAAARVSQSSPAGPAHVLDIGTGTGLLALMLAQQAAARIDAVELDPQAAAQAAENIAASPWKDLIRVIPGDIRMMTGHRAYEVILSNPPFYENQLSSPDPRRRIAHHGEGLLLGELLSLTGRLLTAEGSLFLLLPYRRRQEAEQALQEKGFWMQELVLVRQSPNHDYFRILLQAGRNHRSPHISELTIRDDLGSYTPAFTDLLKPYYLNL